MSSSARPITRRQLIAASAGAAAVAVVPVSVHALPPEKGPEVKSR